MKLAIVVAVIAVIAVLVYADRKWRQWIAAQKRERDRSEH